MQVVLCVLRGVCCVGLLRVLRVRGSAARAACVACVAWMLRRFWVKDAACCLRCCRLRLERR